MGDTFSDFMIEQKVNDQKLIAELTAERDAIQSKWNWFLSTLVGKLNMDESGMAGILVEIDLQRARHAALREAVRRLLDDYDPNGINNLRIAYNSEGEAEEKADG